MIMSNLLEAAANILANPVVLVMKLQNSKMLFLDVPLQLVS